MDRREFIKSLAAGIGLSGLLIEKLVAADDPDESGFLPLETGEDLYVKQFVVDLEPGRLRCVGRIKPPAGSEGLQLWDWTVSTMDPPRPGASAPAWVECMLRRPATASRAPVDVIHAQVSVLSHFRYVPVPGSEIVVAKGKTVEVMARSHAAETITVGTIVIGGRI